jgi:nitronate monooxygenase
VHTFTPQQIAETACAVRKLTEKPFALNLWIPNGPLTVPSEAQFERAFALLDPYYRELGITRPTRPASFGQDFAAQVRAVLDVRPAVFSFVFGIPDPSILQECREREIVTLGTATTPDEAAALDRAGVDCIVASGFEAGGHRGAFLRPAEESLIGTFALIPQVVDRVKALVIAAGGIADARGIKAALALGAKGVQIGTAFLACQESNATAAHRELLFGRGASDTVLTKAFTGRLARSIRNRFAADMKAHEAELLPFPLQLWLAGTLRDASVAQAVRIWFPYRRGRPPPSCARRTQNPCSTDCFLECRSEMIGGPKDTSRRAWLPPYDKTPLSRSRLTARPSATDVSRRRTETFAPGTRTCSVQSSGVKRWTVTEHALQLDERASATRLEETQAFGALSRLVRDLEDGQDHPELWLLLKMVVEEGDAGDLLAVLGALRPLQEARVVKIFDLLEAFIEGIAGPREAGIAKLKQLQTQHRLCPQVAGALSYLMHDGRPPAITPEINIQLVPKGAAGPASAAMTFPKPRGDSYDILEVACFRAALDSAEHYERHFLTCPAFDSDLTLLSKALELAEPNGLFLEFGVASGRTINHMALTRAFSRRRTCRPFRPT